ncbi:hypothetical protein J4410_05140 [Candidatus Woesearchaeota archaeon]|nr:hypothetical protein [Candidatus Woesearchaeota archaeon]
MKIPPLERVLCYLSVEYRLQVLDIANTRHYSGTVEEVFQKLEKNPDQELEEKIRQAIKNTRAGIPIPYKRMSQQKEQIQGDWVHKRGYEVKRFDSRLLVNGNFLEDEEGQQFLDTYETVFQLHSKGEEIPTISNRLGLQVKKIENELKRAGVLRFKRADEGELSEQEDS